MVNGGISTGWQPSAQTTSRNTYPCFLYNKRGLAAHGAVDQYLGAEGTETHANRPLSLSLAYNKHSKERNVVDSRFVEASRLPAGSALTPTQSRCPVSTKASPPFTPCRGVSFTLPVIHGERCRERRLRVHLEYGAYHTLQRRARRADFEFWPCAPLVNLGQARFLLRAGRPAPDALEAFRKSLDPGSNSRTLPLSSLIMAEPLAPAFRTRSRPKPAWMRVCCRVRLSFEERLCLPM